MSVVILFLNLDPERPTPSDEVPELYEGDMALTKQQLHMLSDGQKTSDKHDQEPQIRAALRPSALWPSAIIPFKFHPKIGKFIFKLARLTA